MDNTETQTGDFLIGVDIGGTFTDCVIIDPDGNVTTAKAPSTPGDFALGMVDALRAGAEALEVSVEQLCKKTRLLTHGTTVGTNAVVQRRGAKVGLITTKGHNDVIHIMRGSRGFTGRDLKKVVHFPESKKPEPVVPKTLIRGVSERVDCFGSVVVPLNEKETAAAIDDLVGMGVEAIAVCFLWSFKYPEHERRVAKMIEEQAPNIFVTISSELVPKWGEYERTTATALNAYIGPLTSGYLGRLGRTVEEMGNPNPMQITQCGGGTISLKRGRTAPLLTLDSGPVSGVTGSRYLGDLMGIANIITTDMGGTSFDVGIIHEGYPAFSYVSNVNQYEYFLPKVDIQAIGNGGGSLVRADERTRTLHVGPESAGADPGPVCYGRGGLVPTVTDAALVLGYIGTSSFADGRVKLDKEAAKAAIKKIGKKVGLDMLDCASGIVTIAEHQMANLIRRMTIQKGLDPRDFVLFAFGGAGPMHAGVFAFELGVEKVVIPQGRMASTWCAFGAASADMLHIAEHVNIITSPFSVEDINANFEFMLDELRSQLAAEGTPSESQIFHCSLDVRHKGQINEVEVPLSGVEFSVSQVAEIDKEFHALYQQIYGKGSSFPRAKLEVVTFRVRGSAATPKPRLISTETTIEIPTSAQRDPRPIFWRERGGVLQTTIFWGENLAPGNQINGPAVIETSDTAVVVHPGRNATIDAFGNIELTMET